MTDPRWEAVDRYASDLFAPSSDELDAALRAADAAGLPAISVSAVQGKFLMMMAQAVGARRILELGTLAGYSAIWLAHALPEDGQLVTLELDGKHAAVARENITRAGLSSAVQIVVGAAVETLTKMIRDGTAPFDFIFIDADKPSYPSYLTLTVDLSHVGTVIIADNIVRRGAVIHSDTTDPKVQGVRRFNDLVSNHPRLEATMLQTVGSKGYDGFVFARVAR
jgi:predicted O-methyltransferase YrrM